MDELDEVMKSKLEYIKANSTLTGKELRVPKKSPEKKGGKKAKDFMSNLPFNTASKINHFHEIGWEDPKLDIKVKGNEYKEAGTCPFPTNLEEINLTKINDYETLVYDKSKYNPYDQPYQVYIPHEYLVRKMFFALSA